MVRSDLASSGVIFTLDTETGFREVVFITGAYGLGENIVQGQVNPDEFYVFKPTFKEGYQPIIQKKVGNKEIKMIYGRGDSKVLTRNVEVPEAEKLRFCIDDEEVLELTGYAITIEGHYSNKYGEPKSNGHRMGKGWHNRGTIHSPGKARNCPISEKQRNSGNLCT